MSETSSISEPKRVFPAADRFDPTRATRYTFFMLVKTTPRWLQTTIADRRAFLRTELSPLLQRWTDVHMRYYDAEFFTARCSDVIVWETEHIRSFQAVIEKMRETLFWDTYFEVIEIIPAIEDTYANFYEVAPLNATA